MNEQHAALSIIGTPIRQLHALAEITQERKRQDAKFPDQAPGSGVQRFSWPMTDALMEELGEISKAKMEESPAELRVELVQLGALVVKALEIEEERQELENTPEAIERRREADALFNVGENA